MRVSFLSVGQGTLEVQPRLGCSWEQRAKDAEVGGGAVTAEGKAHVIERTMTEARHCGDSGST